MVQLKSGLTPSFLSVYIKFQFLYGTIKMTVFVQSLVVVVEFQFLYGTIKMEVVANTASPDQPRFNSSMVQLKLTGSIY